MRNILSVLFSFLLIAAVPAFASDWVQESDQDGIKVFTRPIAGSNIKEFKGEAVINANFKKINAVVDNIPNLERWMADTGTNELLDQYNVQPSGSKELFLYNITTTPFGVAYRYSIVYSKVTVTNTSIVRTIELSPESRLTPVALTKLKAVESALPLKKGKKVLDKSVKKQMVCVAELNGEWIFEKINENQTKVTYRIKTNPGGSIPTSLANSTAKSMPYNTIKGLIGQLK
jgi:hypothetical protein